MKNRTLILPALGSCLIIVCSSAHAIDIVKANNTSALNLGASWVGGTAPTPADVAVWNNTVTAANATLLGANASWQGIKIVNPGGLVTLNAGNTLTLGSGGIDMSGATQGLIVKTIVTLGSNQSFSIANGPAAEDLTFDAPSTGTAFNMGGFTVGTSGAGTMRFTSGFAVSNGTFNLNAASNQFQSGGGKTTSLTSDVTLNLSSGKTLVFGINSAPGSPAVLPALGLAVNSAAAININGGTLQINSSGAAGTNRLEQTGKLSFTGTSTVNNASAFGYFSNFSGEIALAGTTIWNESGSSTANTTISGPLTGNGTLSYRGTSTGHRTDLSGNNSGFTGTINLDGSSGNRNLRLTTATAGSASAAWSVAAANVLQVDGVAVNLGTLNGAGGINNSHATNTASISVGAGSFSGVISNGTPANGMGLIKNTAGILSLSGANTYSGLTHIQAGTLTTTSAQTGAGAVTVSDTATFGVTQIGGGDTFNASTLTLGSTGGATLVLTPASSSFAPIVTTNALDINGPTTLRIAGTPVAGTTLIDYTTLGGSSGYSGLNVVMPFRINGGITDNGSAIVLSTVQDETPKWRDGNGVWDINTSGSWKTSATSTTTNYLEGGAGATDSVIFDDTSSGTSPITVTLNSTVSPVAITVAGTKDYIITGSGAIAGNTGISKTGTAALTLATANTFSGGVQLSGGTLNINHASALGSGILTIADGTVLNNTSGASITASPTVASVWNGSFSFTGSNDLNLGGSVTITAEPTVTVAAGTLAFGGIAGAGFGLTKEGNGTLAIGASSYTGGTNVNAGTLRARAAGAFNSTSAVFLADVAGVNLDLNGFHQTINVLGGGGTSGGNVLLGGATLTTSSSGTIGALSGAGGLVKNGTTTFAIAGDTTAYSGTTTINGGVLDVGNAGNFLASSGVLTMGNGSVLQGSGTISRSVGTGNAVVSSNGGFAARGGTLDVDLGSFFNLSSGGNSFGGNLVLGSAGANGLVRVLSSIGINNFGGSRTVTVPVGAGGDSAELAGAITPGSAGGVSGLLKNGGGLLTLSAANTYIGNTNVNEGSLTLAATGQLTFRPTTHGAANKVFDASPDIITPALNPVSLNGVFAIDLSTAAVASGNLWTLVDHASVNASYGSSFSVAGFDDSDLDNIWTKVDASGNTWSFSEATGTLSVIPSAYFLWITGNFANGTLAVAQQGKAADPDGDGVSNLLEYAIAGLDPTVPNGSPGAFAGNLLSYSKRLPLDATLSYRIEQSIDLGATPWAEVPAGIGYVNNGTTISYELPANLSVNFIRLSVTVP